MVLFEETGKSSGRDVDLELHRTMPTLFCVLVSVSGTYTEVVRTAAPVRLSDRVILYGLVRRDG